MRRSMPRSHPGQSLVVVALFAVLLFVLVGFAIDGGLLYTQRRLMQNTADAACLAAANKIALGQSNNANSAAITVITENLGPTPGAGSNAPGTLSYTNIAEVYNNGALAGSDTSLTHGIEIAGADVRVALQSPAYTFFLRLAGIDEYTASARAYCNASAGGGVTPFAVARWRGYDTNDNVQLGLTTDKPLPQTYRRGNTNVPMIVRDLLARSNQSVIAQWPGWGTNSYPGDPQAGTGLYSDPTFPASTTSGQEGFETVIAGQEATPNVPSNSPFSGPIVLDYRETSKPQPLFYNGLTPNTALNQYKDFATRYIMGPYPGPFVIPGQQIGFYSGVSAGQIEIPFNRRYNVNDIVTVLVYNGTIYDSPSFSLAYPSTSDSAATRPADTYAGTCTIPSGYAFDGLTSDQKTRKAPARFRITVLPQNASTYRMRAFLSDDPIGWGEIKGEWSATGSGQLPLHINPDPRSISVPSTAANPSGRTLDFYLAPSAVTPCTANTGTFTETFDLPLRKNGAQTIYLEGRAEETAKRVARYAFLNMNAAGNDFYAYVPGELVYQPMEPGQNTSVEFKLDTVAGTSLYLSGGGAQAQVTEYRWFAADNVNTPITTPNGITVGTRTQGGGANRRNYLDISVGNGAQTGREYYVRVAVTYAGRTHYLWYYLQVKMPLNNSSSVTQYIHALGYAAFKITMIDSNTIRGRAVSGLMQDPNELSIGFQPRLVPWE